MGRSVSVRAAGIDDVDSVVALWSELASTANLAPDPETLPARVAAAIDRPGYRTLVAVDDGEVLGFVTFGFEEPNPLVETCTLVVTGMHVALNERRRGIGAQLLAAVLQAAEGAQAAEIAVTLPPEMRAANRYLAKLGFAPILVRRATSTIALREKVTPAQTRTRRAVLKARRAGKQPVTAVGRVLQTRSVSSVTNQSQS
jgi:GNAT superfamily N-acetyltransferase